MREYTTSGMVRGQVKSYESPQGKYDTEISSNVTWEQRTISPAMREEPGGHAAGCLWLTGPVGLGQDHHCQKAGGGAVCRGQAGLPAGRRQCEPRPERRPRFFGERAPREHSACRARGPAYVRWGVYRHLLLHQPQDAWGSIPLFQSQ